MAPIVLVSNAASIAQDVVSATSPIASTAVKSSSAVLLSTLTSSISINVYNVNGSTTTVAIGDDGSSSTDWESIVWTNFLGGLLLWSSVVLLCIYCYKRACTVFCVRCCDLCCGCCSPKVRRRLLCCCSETPSNATAPRREHTAATPSLNPVPSAGDVRLALPPPSYTDALNMPKPPAEYYLKQEAAAGRRFLTLSPKSYLLSPDDDIPELSEIAGSSSAGSSSSSSPSDDNRSPPSATFRIESETQDQGQGHVNLGSDIREEDEVSPSTSSSASHGRNSLIHSSDGGIVIAVASQVNSSSESQLPEQRPLNTQHPHPLSPAAAAAGGLPLPVGQHSMVHSFTTRDEEGEAGSGTAVDQLPSYEQALQMLTC